MDPIRLFSIVAWILLPTVMFGGYSLLRLMIRGNLLTPFKETYFRAGHAHAATLLLMALLYFEQLARLNLPEVLEWLACTALLLGVLLVSGGFFLHMARGVPQRSSTGTTVTSVGTIVLSMSVLFLAYSLATS